MNHEDAKKNVYTMEEVAKHNTLDDLWIVVEGGVYDVTHFSADHPGGKKVLLREGGKDATKKFRQLHSSAVLPTYGPELLVGTIGTRRDAEASKSKRQNVRQVIEAMGGYGDLVPYGDPNWYRMFKSPYYKDSHRKVRAAVREFVDREMIPFVGEWDEKYRVPQALWKKAADAGILGAALGAPWRTELNGPNVVGGISPEEFDEFHSFIVMDELSRCGSVGAVWGLVGGLSIGLPSLVKFGRPAVRDRVARECLSGRKQICLAVTEPYAGSDVANLRATAKLSADGSHYVLNGEKKWITNGLYADYFTVACRTGGEGAMGVSLLLVERGPGVKTTQIKCSGVWSSGTTYVTFEDVRVPTENLIGKENQGFKAIMHQFNSERFGTAALANRCARVCLEESILYALKRKTFGKALIRHQVIRHKLAEMAMRVEATHAWLENLAYQSTQMDEMTAMIQLGGPIALIKAQAANNFEYCAREAQQIFGGAGYTRTGAGATVERLAREVRATAVPAGSIEIMFDLAVRQAEMQARMVQKAVKKMSSRL